MSFMFKGPAALTGASTAASLAATGAISTTSTLAVTGASTLTGAATLSSTIAVTGAATLSSTLGVTGTSTLADINASGTLTMGNNTNIVVSGGGTITGLPDAAVNNSHAASKKYVDDQVLAASGGETVVDVSSITGEVFTQPAFSGKRLFLLNADAHTGTGTMTLNLSSGAGVANGDTWTLVWAQQQGTGTSTLGIKVDLASDKLYDANGSLNRYITLPNVGSSVRLVRHGSGVWHIIGGSGGIPSTS